MDKIKIGISSCLLGNKVRYDGGHKHSRYITDSLGRYFEFLPFCPEVAVGLGVPRSPIRLVKVGEQVRVQGIEDSRRDVTDALKHYGQEVVPQLHNICGFIFKQGSPSCGVEQVKLFDQNGVQFSESVGAFAQEIIKARPELPVEEEGRLMNPQLRDGFIERVFVLKRWLDTKQKGIDVKSLIDFHRRHKLILLAHDELQYRELGRMVAEVRRDDVTVLINHYILGMMKAIKKPATPGSHANVLTHILGFFKELLSRDDKEELLQLIEEYRQGGVPLLSPITMLKHYLHRYPNEYLSQQYYLYPHPAELMLRNHI